MPPSLSGGFPSTGQMVDAVLCFIALTTPIAVLLWFGIRRFRKRPMHWWLAWMGSAFICAVVSGIDVSFGGNSGIFSIFWAVIVPVYMGVVLLIVSLAAFVVR